MSAISLKLPDKLLEASDHYANALNVSRAEYIRQALARMNQEVEAQLRAHRMAAASHKVRRESMRVNKEFAAFETDPNA